MPKKVEKVSIFADFYDGEKRKKREEELNRFIHSDEHKNMWVEQGFSSEVVDKFAEEFFYIDWLYTHHSFQENFVNFQEDTIRYFLNDNYSEEFLAEYFSHEWEKDKSEVEAIIKKVKVEQEMS